MGREAVRTAQHANSRLTPLRRRLQVSRRGLSGADIAFSGATTVQPEPQRQKQKQQQPAAVTGQLQAESKRRLSPPDAEAAAGAPLLPAVLRVPSAQGAQASDRQMPTEVAGPLQQLAPGSHSLATTVDAAAAASLHAAGLHAALAVSAPLMLSQPLAIAPSAQQAACPLPALLPMAPPATQPMLQQQPQLPAVSAPLLQPAAAFDPHAAWFKSHFQASVGGGGGAPLPSSPRQHQQHQQVFAGMAAPVGVLAGFGGVDDPMAAAAAARKQMQPWWKNKEATFGEVRARLVLAWRWAAAFSIAALLGPLRTWKWVCFGARVPAACGAPALWDAQEGGGGAGKPWRLRSLTRAASVCPPAGPRPGFGAHQQQAPQPQARRRPAGGATAAQEALQTRVR